MKIAYEHLLRFLINKPSIEDLSIHLFQLGHEHEVNNSIFDFEFTPNRGDCLSLQGLARDLNVFYQTNMDIPIYKDDIPLLELNFINHSQDKCPQISFLNIEIKGETLEYKDYLEDYFRDLKINKNNFFTDISNYVAYELGQPTHSYEFSSIGTDITLQESSDNSSFLTLLGNSIELKSPDLVFTSEGKTINLSGVMGGKNSACTVHTKNALVECAYFMPEAIIGKSVKYNLHSDASHKFERGTDPKCHEKVLRRFIHIVSEHAEITKLGLYCNNNINFEEIELSFELNKINKILGTEITEENYKNILIKLGFNVNGNIKVPSFRNDINHQNDLSEEIARVIGYDNLPINTINIKRIPKKEPVSKEEILKTFLINKGFTEVINTPFCSTSNEYSIELDNPLDNSRRYLRTDITNSLLENLIYNEKRQKDSIKLFEISDIYNSIQDTHEKRLAVIVSGRRGQNYLDFSQKLDDQYLIKLFKEINIDINKSILDIDRTGLGSKIKTPIFALELRIDEVSMNFTEYVPIAKTLSNLTQYQPISEFPSISRDFSFLIKDSSKIFELQTKLNNAKVDYIKDSFMFDLFHNPKTNEIKLGYRFIFQSHERTLTDKEIELCTKDILEPILKIDSVSLPGRF